MKEFIEKLIGRLEEYIETAKAEGDYTYIEPFEIVKNAVNQLAEEYNNESVKGDLISRSDVMEMLTNIELSCTVIPITEAKLQLRDIPTADNDGWIPCSDRLPEPECGIHVWISFTNQYCSYTKEAIWEWNKFVWMNGKEIKDKPIAWKLYSRPAPYQPKGE